jgi:alkaline phosphatase D
MVVPTLPSKILLASCNSQHHQPVLWDAMMERNAASMVWVGDAIYGDDFHPSPANGQGWSKWMKQRKVRAATPLMLQEAYEHLLSNPGYRRFTRRDGTLGRPAGGHSLMNMTVLGVWDDHDYGINNGDKRYPFQTESAMIYLDFLKRSSSGNLDLRIMEQRAASGRGLYGVKVLDFYRPTGQELLSDDEAGIEPDVDHSIQKLSDRSVAIFLLDCRTNKSPWKTDYPDKFLLDYEGDFLGEDQWKWLEKSLQRSTAAVNVIVQGVQVHADH